ncbi:translation initiation factor 4F, cap-binding subunit [Guillardia theta CCMP2712]|uniref:Translation initiation factor 4F, cap-binding subunit n=2 Tax=Guillardia theta TaxID=55529 RepID=L1IJ52_GUITC|nr:translation initiation factor 4F, cap-binding subunit [Guillardia theta CCMP2712]EKX35949.1 translation initiation factor 4F, cap-binding subunit [Guillardia theta CCMP2712]|eukprot:XP_005822929.1 translation initiation factor 4F, cap-binding subunit [Guillardia theta CCMP2712]
MSDTAAATSAEQNAEVPKEAASNDTTGHPLETGWTFWFDKKIENKSHAVMKASTYFDHLKNLGSFRTIEEFWDLYSQLSRPYDMHQSTTYHVFREGYMPMWETFPHGGAWIIRFKKQNHHPSPNLSKCWEELVLACVGEAFAEPDLVGVMVSVKPKEDIIQIWNKDNEDNESVKDELG